MDGMYVCADILHTVLAHSRRGPGVVVHERELPEALALSVRGPDLHLLLLAGEGDKTLQDALFHDVEVVSLLVLKCCLSIVITVWGIISEGKRASEGGILSGASQMVAMGGGPRVFNKPP